MIPLDEFLKDAGLPQEVVDGINYNVAGMRRDRLYVKFNPETKEIQIGIVDDVPKEDPIRRVERLIQERIRKHYE